MGKPAATLIISILAAAASAFSVSESISSAGILHPTRHDKVLKRRTEEEDRTQPTTTKAGGNLIDHFTESLSLTPFERVALTCYGNLQVVFSAYYNKPINVTTDLFDQVPTVEEIPNATPPIAEWDRVVSMTISDSLFCKATCKMRVYDEEMYQFVTKQDFGIGQLLRWKNLQPKFGLYEAGRSEHGGLWRFYSMDCPGKVEFDILEEFPEDAFSLGSAK